MNTNKQNKNKRIILISTLILILIIGASLFISGCTSNRPRVVNIYTGTEGITVKLADNNPPSEVYEGSQVILMAELWNKGAYSLIKGQTYPAYISVNLDEVYFSVGKEEHIFTNDRRISTYIEGKSEVWPTGEKSIINIGTLNVNEIPGTRESPLTKIDINVCYTYRTYFSENICVDSDIYNVDQNPICRNQKTYTYSGQGAPIAVTRLDVDMIPVKIDVGDGSEEEAPILELDNAGEIENIVQGSTETKNIIMQPNFRIYFQNTAGGILMPTAPLGQAYNPCVTGPMSNGEFLRITAKLGELELNCSNAEIKMYSNEGSVRCWLSAEDATNSQFNLNRNFELPLTLEAEYFYRTTASKEIKIIRVS